LTITLNFIGLLLAATNIWTYPRQYTGACVLGNLLVAILVRNELFGRLLYLIINKLFAKVEFTQVSSTNVDLSATTVDTSVVPPRLHLHPATPWRHSFGLCHIRICLAHLPSDVDIHQPQEYTLCNPCHRCYHEYFCRY
jgi:hypothetical protein